MLLLFARTRSMDRSLLCFASRFFFSLRVSCLLRSLTAYADGLARFLHTHTAQRDSTFSRFTQHTIATPVSVSVL
jgi:hypothetical protein